MERIEMNENAKKWVKALRSGDYEQTRNTLRQDDSFCCLGVACDLHAKATGNEWTEDETTWGWQYFGSSHVLPYEVVDWLGLNDSTGEISDDQSLSSDNDRGASFADIARLIEEKEGVLFPS